MNIRNIRELKSFAAQRLSVSQSGKRIVLIYAGLIIGLSGLVSLISYVLGLQIDQLSGLSNLSTRTTLSSLQTTLPIALSLVTMCIEVGYLAAMLRTARGQYTSPQTLRLGFDRFWVLLRCTLIKSMIYFGMVFSGVYLGIVIYMLTPLSKAAMEILMPIVSEASVLDPTYVLDDLTYARLMEAMTPAFLICGVILCVLLVPMLYGYRMTNYILIDRPAMGALAALRESRKMMRGNRIALLKLDVSLWWYYLAVALANVVCYGDAILAMAGIQLPLHADVVYFVFYALYLGLMFVLYYFLRNRLEVTYALAYDAIKPEEKQDNGVVLGNIFNM